MRVALRIFQFLGVFPIFPARYLLMPFVPEQLSVSRRTFRPEQNADGIADRHHRAVRPVRHQSYHPGRDNAIGSGGRRREDALPLLRGQARSRG